MLGPQTNVEPGPQTNVEPKWRPQQGPGVCVPSGVKGKARGQSSRPTKPLKPISRIFILFSLNCSMMAHETHQYQRNRASPLFTEML